MKFEMELEEHTPSNTDNPCADCVLRSGFMYCLDKKYCKFKKTGKTWKKVQLVTKKTEKYFSMEYIRRTYNCPAKRGMQIRFRKCIHEEWVTGKIIGSRGQYLRVIFKGNLGVFTLHPAWNIEYLEPMSLLKKI